MTYKDKIIRHLDIKILVQKTILENSDKDTTRQIIKELENLKNEIIEGI